MNKKFILPLCIVLGITVISAISYYALFSASFTVLPSITLSECDDVFGEVYDGEVYEGSECLLTNNAPSQRDLVIINDAAEGIEVSYKGTLDMTRKDTSTWEAVGEPIEIAG